MTNAFTAAAGPSGRLQTALDAATACDLETLAIWQETMQTPCVAIGGITPENCGPVIEAGADFLAVSAGVWAWPQGPGAAVKAFRAAIDKAIRP